MAEELKLSVSKTKTFLDCAKKFKFSYILKLPKKEFEYHTFGKFCHKVLEDFHMEYVNGSERPHNKAMGEAFKAAKVEYKDKLTPEMEKECFEICDQYLKLLSEQKKNNAYPNVIGCEKSFSLNVRNDVILNGMIDRIQIDGDGVLHVADYKTTKNKKYLKKDLFQLLTYAYVLASENPEVKKIRGSYILLRHAFEQITVEFDIEEILKIKDKYIEYADKILSEQEYKANPTVLCGYCDFLDFCDEGKGKVKPKISFGETDW